MKAFLTDAPIGRRLFWPLCFAICIVGFALRLPTLSSRSLWLDEAYSAWFCALPLYELWTSVPLYETHPPMYYSLLKGWSSLFGNSEAALRSMSVLASVANILLVAISGRALRCGQVGDRVGLLAALFLAMNRGSIEYAQQARPYAIETLAASATILFSLIVLRRLASTVSSDYCLPRLWPSVFGLGSCAGAMLWLHNTAIFIAFGIWAGLAVSLVVMVRGPRIRQALTVFTAGGLALLIWAPFVPMLLRAISSMSKLSFWITMGAKDLVSAWYLATGGALPMLPVLILCFLGLVVLWRVARAETLHLCIVLILPLACVLGYSYLAKPIYISRLFGWLAPPLMTLAAIGVWSGIRHTKKRNFVILMTITLLLVSTGIFYTNPTEDWRGLIGTVAAQAKPGDAVIVYPNELTVVMHYYVPRQSTFPDIYYIPAKFPALGRDTKYISNLGAPAIQPIDRLQVRAIKSSHRRIWLIHRFSGLYDTNNIIHKELVDQLTLTSTLKKESAQIELYE